MKITLEILDKLNDSNFEAFVVGGAVRDLYLGNQPKDYDIVTSATPEQVKEVFPEAIVAGNSFQVSLYKGREIATYRKDLDTHAVVAHTLKEDVLRRDFTINSIALDRKSLWKLWCRDTDYILPKDYVGGMKDLKDKVLRFIGDPVTRILEDPVRMLRGLRFASQGFELEYYTHHAIFLHRDLLEDIPKERIFAEVKKAFKGNAYKFVRLLDEFELLSLVFPSIEALKGIDGGDYHNETVLTHCMMALKATNNLKNWRLKLACLYHDVGKFNPTINDKGFNTFYEHNKNGLDKIVSDLRELSAPNEDINYVKYLSLYHMGEITSKRTIRRLVANLHEHNLPIKDWCWVRYADNWGNAKGTNTLKDIRRKYKDILTVLNEKAPFSVKDLAVNGYDMMELGLQKEEIGKALAYLFEQVMDGTENEKDILMKLVKEYLESEKN